MRAENHPMRRALFTVTVTMACLGKVASGQIVRDQTLGAMKGQALPTINGRVDITADLGTKVGTNLFHSFSQFNVQAGQTAAFTGPADVANVLTRVTGGQTSTINGLLKTEGMPTANFFFINPAGVMFGAGGQIDVPGSFVVTTGDVLQLADGGQFHATDPGASVLTMAPVSAFGFLKPQASSVSVQSTALVTSPGQRFSAIGGDILIRNGQLIAPAGTIDLVSVGPPATVTYDDSPGGSSLVSPITSRTGNVTIDASHVGSPAAPLAGFRVQAGQLAFDNGGSAWVTTFADFAPGVTQIQTSSLHIDGGGSGFALTGPSSVGTGIFHINTAPIAAGDLSIDADEIDVINGGSIVSVALGLGKGSDIQIDANRLTIDRLDSAGSAGVITDTLGPGDGGNIRIGSLSRQAQELMVAGGGLIVSSTQNAGNAGNVDLFATLLVVDGRFMYDAADPLVTPFDLDRVPVTFIGSRSVSTGDSGQVSVNCSTIEISRAGQLGTVTLSNGDGGNVDIVAESLRVLSNGSIAANTFGEGKSGNITINARSVEISSQGSSQSLDFGIPLLIRFPDLSGDSQDGLGLKSETFRLTSATGITAATLLQGNGGSGGNITIEASVVDVLEGGLIAVTSFGSGAAGVLSIKADDLTVRRGDTDESAGLVAISLGTGGGGRIDLDLSRSLAVADGGVITADNFGSGESSSITILGTGDIRMSNALTTANGFATERVTAISVSNHNGAASGDLTIRGRSMSMTDGTIVSAAVFGDGAGGSVNIDVGVLSVDSRSLITSATLDPQLSSSAGDVNIKALAGASLSNNSLVAVFAPLGTAGTLTLNGGTKLAVTNSLITAAGADGGNIDLIASERVLIFDSTITARASANGGRITIDPIFTVLLNSTINGLSDGTPVLVTIDTQFYFDSNSEILTNTPTDFAETDLSGSLLTLSSALLGDQARLEQRCEVRLTGDASSFTISGTGGVRPDPAGWVPSLK